MFACIAMALHNTIGKIGEQYAADILMKKGYKIECTNWHMGHLELDIIASNNREIAFVEVKTRTSLFGGVMPEEYVDQTKQARMVAAANAYIKYNKIEKLPRFDIIGLLVNKETGELLQQNHLENAFTPKLRTIHTNSFNGQWRWKHKTHSIHR